MADGIRLKHRLEYAAFRAGLAGTRLLGDGGARRAGGAAGRAGHALGIKRSVVESNIRLAFPEASDAWVNDVAAESYRHLGRETLMMLRLSSMSADEVVERTRLVDAAEPTADYRRGNGVVVVTGHLGNWEIGGAAIAARGYRIAAVAKRAANPLFYARVMEARQRVGMEIIDFATATRPGLRALRDGKVLALAADQYAGRSGVRAPFFGHVTSTFRGPAIMALRTGAPLYLGVALRQPDHTYEIRLSAIPVSPTGDMERDVLTVTTEYLRQLEAAVRQAPGQYLWHHRRWRPEEPPVGGAADRPDGGQAAVAEEPLAEQ